MISSITSVPATGLALVTLRNPEILLIVLLICAIVSRFVGLRHQKDLIEKAASTKDPILLEEIKRIRKRASERPLFLGLILVGAGCGMVITHKLELMSTKQDMAGAGIIMGMIGVTMIVFYFIVRKRA